MTETKDLIPLENPQPSALFAPGGLDSILSRIEADARALVPDISTVKGRSAVASLAAKVAKAKTYLDGLGKDYTADLKRQTGAVDAERKVMRDRLDALKEEVRKPLTDWEQAETDRVADIRMRIARFALSEHEIHGGIAMTAGQIEGSIRGLDAVEIDDSFAEFQAEAQAAKEACLYRLTQARDAAFHREAEAARIAAEAEAARAKAQAEREERIAREAAERATREAQARIEAERRASAESQARAQREAQEAQRRAQEAEARATREAAMARARAEVAVDQERARAESERKAKADADAKREADAEHRERIHAEIVYDLEIAGIDDYDDEVEAIAAGRIRHLRIIY